MIYLFQASILLRVRAGSNTASKYLFLHSHNAYMFSNVTVLTNTYYMFGVTTHVCANFDLADFEGDDCFWKLDQSSQSV